ncbi:MAG TPA: ferrochelatase [Myxococcales bacterium]|jgi:ferrochelatase|nr:ferrochelatase [Myxococcales bacterium]
MSETSSRRRGLLLVNLGTPEDPTTPAVRRYLREFLSDPRVLDLSPLGRWLLLNLVILPIRPARSAEAYRKVWTKGGSPLLVHSRRLAEAVADAVVGDFVVSLAMRYGRPSIPEGLEALRRAKVESVTVLPLYPQEAASSTSSTLARVYQLAAEGWDAVPLRVVPPFFDSRGFLDAFAEVGRPVLAESRPEHVLFSFHGLPERHVRRTAGEPSPCRFDQGCCARLGPDNARCYRAQCFHTARELAGRLGLPEGGFSVAFQSRLGRTPWIQPFTDRLLVELPARGVKRVAVMVPSFVADCLETLEEIGLRGAESFRAAGGEQLTLVPSLNAHPAWVAEVVRLARAASG